MAFLDLNGLSHFLDKLKTTFARNDGSYSTLTSGNAEQLVSTVGVDDKTPYLFRTTGGSADVGDRVKLSEITGGTVAWNQLAPAINGSTYIVTVGATDANGAITITGVASAANRNAYLSAAANKNHKYLVMLNNKVIGETNTGRIYVLGNYASLADATNKEYVFVNNTSYDYIRLATDTLEGAVYDQKFIPQIFDLTQMFGSTIADYIYGLESGTAGAGVAWFRKLFPKDYYAYDAGSLLSVKTTAHKEYGFNAYYNSTGKAKVVGGQVYQITGTYTALSLDGTSITPDASGYFTPSASGEITVTGGNSTDTCIHLKWDGERDGEYEPYEANTYALDDVELRGIPKLDASNNLYYDGDSYAPDGTVTRKCGVYKLTGNEAAYTDWGDYVAIKINTAWPADPISRSPGLASSGAVAYQLNKEWSYFRTSMSAADFKTYVQNNDVYLAYELATPTTESADPYQETQVCNDFGTEEFVDERTVPMPVGANALYQANLRAKLEMAPDSPDGDGDYIVRQTDGLNEYVAVSSNSTISGLSTRCPACPTDTDGNFVLKAVVSSGSVTYSWVAEA